MSNIRSIGGGFSALHYSRLTWPGETRRPVDINIDIADLKVYSSRPLKCGSMCFGDQLVVLGTFFDDTGAKVVCGLPPENFAGKCISGCEAHALIKEYNHDYDNVMCSHARMLNGAVVKNPVDFDY